MGKYIIPHMDWQEYSIEGKLMSNEWHLYSKILDYDLESKIKEEKKSW